MIGRRVHASALAVVAATAASCATTGDGGDGGENIPNAAVGPFRELRDDELGQSHTSPIALRDPVRQARDVSVIDADGDPATPATFAYAAIVTLKEKKAKPDEPTDRIARYASDDGRTFGNEGVEVLAPTQGWEGDTLGGPCAVRRGGETWLYYAAGGSIGLATSSDGVSFTSRPGPVLRPVEPGSTLSDPHVVDLPGGAQRMFVTVVAAGESRSTVSSFGSSDGTTWSDPRPVVVDGARLAGASIGAPSALFATSPTGRDILHLYVEARLGEDPPSIELLSQLAGDPAWDLAAAPVFAPRLGARAPDVARTTGEGGQPATMLFVTSALGRTNDDWGVAAAVAPGTAVLGAPVDRDAQGGAAPE